MQIISEAERIQAPVATGDPAARQRQPLGNILVGAALVVAFLAVTLGPAHFRGYVFQPLILPFTLVILGLYLALVAYLAVWLRWEHRDLVTINSLLADERHREALVMLFADTGSRQLHAARPTIQAALPGARRGSLVTDRLWDLLVALRTNIHPGNHRPSARGRTVWVERMAQAFVSVALGAGIFGTLWGLIELFDQGTGAAREGSIMAAMGGMDQALAASAVAIIAALDAKLLYTCLVRQHGRLHRRLDHLAGAWLLPLVQEVEAPPPPPPPPPIHVPPLPLDEERLATFLAPHIVECLEPIAGAAARVEETLDGALKAQRELVDDLQGRVERLPNIEALAALVSQSAEALRTGGEALTGGTGTLSEGVQKLAKVNATLVTQLASLEEQKDMLHVQEAALTSTVKGLGDRLVNMEDSSVRLVSQQGAYLEESRQALAAFGRTLGGLSGAVTQLHQGVQGLTAWLTVKLQEEEAP